MIPMKPAPTVEEPDEWSPEFNDFIASCLKKDPEERVSCEILLSHPFIADEVARIQGGATGSPLIAQIISDNWDAILKFRMGDDEEEGSDGEEEGGATLKKGQLQQSAPQQEEEEEEEDEESNEDKPATMVRCDTMVRSNNAANKLKDQPTSNNSSSNGGGNDLNAALKYFQSSSSSPSNNDNSKSNNATKGVEDADRRATQNSFADQELGNVSEMSADELNQQLVALEMQFRAEMEELRSAYESKKSTLSTALQRLKG